MLKHTLLGLLAQEPRHGYDLKSTFETLLGGTWPLNIGQVYTTLNRLERDGLVECELVPQDLLPDRKVFAITEAGRSELERWLSEPATNTMRLKDEFFIKLLVHQLVSSNNALPLIWKQRQIYMQKMAQLTSLLSDSSIDPATILLIEGAILHIDADLKWLDLCEERLEE
ncbi:MAG: PadR family transcriptional regulator [Anaerolineales bacterium]|nr:PadR family transcriptional regulator [Anaerolineales bacterium]